MKVCLRAALCCFDATSKQNWQENKSAFINGSFTAWAMYKAVHCQYSRCWLGDCHLEQGTFKVLHECSCLGPQQALAHTGLGMKTQQQVSNLCYGHLPILEVKNLHLREKLHCQWASGNGMMP